MPNVTYDMDEVVKDVKKNVQHLAEEWKKIIQIQNNEDKNCEEHASVSFHQIEQLQREVTGIKKSLPKLLQDVRNSLRLSKETKEALLQTQKLLEESNNNALHLNSRLQSAKSERDMDRKAKLNAQNDMTKISEQLCLQSEYCASMGAVSCTLLWRASQQEQIIPALLAGTQMKSYLSVVCHTLSSFLATYEEEELPSEMTEEIQFVLALVGTVTNVAASAIGREFLAGCEQCRLVLDTFVSLLSRKPSKQTSCLKNLSLMCLYNLSINQTGLKVLTSINGLVPILAWLLSVEEANDIRLHTLLLLHSLILEPGNLSLLLEAKEGLPLSLMDKLCISLNQEVREVASEIKEALNVLNVEQ